MDENGLPPASASNKNLKFGSLSIKTERPTQSFSDAKKGLEKLEKAAKDNVFKENESNE